MALLLPKPEQPFSVYSGDDQRKEGFAFEAEDGTTLKAMPTDSFAPDLGFLIIEGATHQPILPPAEWQPNFQAMAVLQAIHDMKVNRTAA